MSKNGNQKQVCVKFVRYFSVDKGSYSEEDWQNCGVKRY